MEYLPSYLLSLNFTTRARVIYIIILYSIIYDIEFLEFVLFRQKIIRIYLRILWIKCDDKREKDEYISVYLIYFDYRLYSVNIYICIKLMLK